jgi:hypothetical protein
MSRLLLHGRAVPYGGHPFRPTRAPGKLCRAFCEPLVFSPTFSAAPYMQSELCYNRL